MAHSRAGTGRPRARSLVGSPVRVAAGMAAGIVVGIVVGRVVAVGRVGAVGSRRMVVGIAVGIAVGRVVALALALALALAFVVALVADTLVFVAVVG